MRAVRGARGTSVRASRKNWVSDAIATRASAAASLALVPILNVVAEEVTYGRLC